jgi:cytochrome c oxidase subunit II
MKRQPPAGGRHGLATRLARLAPAGALGVAGCRGERAQSALHPAGPAAEAIADLWWVMFGLGAAVFVAVMALALLAVLRGRRSEGAPDRPPLGTNAFIWTGGVVLPAIILIYLLIASLRTTVDLRPPAGAVTVEVIGHKWWWEVRYPDLGIVTANEIRIPAGEPVLLRVASADVIHSFWVPRLHGKIDMLPEVVNAFWIQADEPGTFRGQCAEFCGLQHARMAFVVVAEPPDAFREWSARLATPAGPPETEQQQRGAVVFREAGCDNCHAIQGAPWDPGEVGPDLTHFGSRLTIGAATRPNTTGDLSGWISNPQAIKPGNHMPPTYLAPEDLHALVAYLQSLR